VATSFVEEVLDYAQAGGIGTLGDDLFVTIMPDDEGVGPTVVLQEFPGGPQPFYSKAPTINLAWTVRAKDYDAARAKMAAIGNYFHAEVDVILENSRVLFFACNTPGSIGMDTRERHLLRMAMIAKATAYTPPEEEEGEPDDGGDGDGGSPGGGKDPNPGDLDP